MNKNLLKNSKMTKYYLIFAQMLFYICFDIRFEVEYFNLESSLFCFVYYLTKVSTTNLEAGPRFAWICSEIIKKLNFILSFEVLSFLGCQTSKTQWGRRTPSRWPRRMEQQKMATALQVLIIFHCSIGNWTADPLAWRLIYLNPMGYMELTG